MAAVLGATQFEGVPALEQQTFLLLGAGQANIGSARLLVQAMVAGGLSGAEARDRIWMFDSKVALPSVCRFHDINSFQQDDSSACFLAGQHCPT